MLCKETRASHKGVLSERSCTIDQGPSNQAVTLLCTSYLAAELEGLYVREPHPGQTESGVTWPVLRSRLTLAIVCGGMLSIQIELLQRCSGGQSTHAGLTPQSQGPRYFLTHRQY